MIPNHLKKLSNCGDYYVGVFYTNPPEEDEFVCVLTSIWATWNPSFISNYERRRWTGVRVDNSVLLTAAAVYLGRFYAPTAAKGDTFSRDYKPDKWHCETGSNHDVFVVLSTVFLTTTIQFVT